MSLSACQHFSDNHRWGSAGLAFADISLQHVNKRYREPDTSGQTDRFMLFLFFSKDNYIDITDQIYWLTYHTLRQIDR